MASAKNQLELSERLALHVSPQLHCRNYSDNINVEEEKRVLKRQKLRRPVLVDREEGVVKDVKSDCSKDMQQLDIRPVTSVSKYSDPDKALEHSAKPRLVKSGVSQASVIGGRSVGSKELNSIVSRLVRPTVASRGGIDLLNKDFVYIKQKPRKTMPEVPGLERRYLGLQSVSQTEMKSIVARLTKMTTAYTAKFGPNHNTWVDDSPRRNYAQKT